MSRGSRTRDSEYSSRDDRRPRGSDSSLESRIYIGNINVKNFSYREINDWMSKYGKVLDVTFHERHVLVQFDRESDCRRAIDREKGQSFRGTRFDIRFAHSSDGSMSSNRSEVPRSRSPRALPYERDSRDMSPGYRDSVRDSVRDRSPIERERYYKERRPTSPDLRSFERPRINDEIRHRPEIRPEYATAEYEEPNWNAPPLTNKITSERPGFDAAIIVMSSDLLNYAETIESKLQRQIALTTHIIVLKEESHANACIDDLNNKAVLYAFLVNHVNEKHLSCTLRILYGSGQEHRNMLLTTALSFVARNFEDYQKRVRELKSIAPKPNYDPSRMPPGFLAPDDKTIYQLHLLADSRMLSIEELNEVDEFIQKRIQILAQAEGISVEKPTLMAPVVAPNTGPSKAISSAPPNSLIHRDEKTLIAQQNQLHSKILNILKPGSQQQPVAAAIAADNKDQSSIGGTLEQQFNSYSSDGNMMSSSNNPLTNPKVQQALDSLMQSKFRPNLQEQSLTEDTSRNFTQQSISNQYSNMGMGMGMNMGGSANPGTNLHTGTSNMNPGTNVHSGVSNTNPGTNMNTGANNMNPSTNLYTGANTMNPGTNLHTGATNMNPSSNLHPGPNNMNQGTNLHTGTNSMNASTNLHNPGMSHGMRPPNQPIAINQPARANQQAHPYAGSGYQAGYYQQQHQVGQPLYRPRQPFQPRPQYPGY